MNGILLIGTSVTKGMGPIFAGFLVSISFSSKSLWIPPEQGSILIFGTIAIMGLLTTRLAVWLEDTAAGQNEDRDLGGVGS